MCKNIHSMYKHKHVCTLYICTHRYMHAHTHVYIHRLTHTYTTKHSCIQKCKASKSQKVYMLKIWLTSPACTTVLIIWRAARSCLIIAVIAISLFIIHVIFIHNSKDFTIIFCIGSMIFRLVAGRYMIFLWKKIITITLLVKWKNVNIPFKNIIEYPLNLQSYWKTFKTSADTKRGLYRWRHKTPGKLACGNTHLSSKQPMQMENSDNHPVRHLLAFSTMKTNTTVHRCIMTTWNYV